MKHLFIPLSALAALALVSCSKQEAAVQVNDAQSELSFSTYTGRAATKATADITHPFKLYVTYQTNTGDTPASYVPSTEVEYNSTDACWKISGGTKYYWPAFSGTSHTMTFYGVMDYATTTVTSRDAAATVSVSDLSGTEDLCTAYATATSKPDGDIQALTFEHATTKCSFKVQRCTTDVSGLEYEITGFTIAAKKNGTYTLSTKAWSDIAAGSAATYTVPAYDATSAPLGYPAKNTFTSASSVFGTNMIIPQSGVVVTVSYKVYQGGEVIADYTGDSAKTATIDMSSGRGKAVTYTLSLTSGDAVTAITFTSSENDWSTQTEESTGLN